MNTDAADSDLAARNNMEKKKKKTEQLLHSSFYQIFHEYIPFSELNWRLSGMGVWELWFVEPQALHYRTDHNRAETAENIQRNYWESLLYKKNLEVFPNPSLEQLK